MNSVLVSLSDSLELARLYAEQSQYDTSIIYFDSVMAKIRQSVYY